MRKYSSLNAGVLAAVIFAGAGARAQGGSAAPPAGGGQWEVVKPKLSAVKSAVSDKVYNVTAYGAKWDGTTLTTKELQAALDACAKAGGGVVEIPEGNYLTGSLAIGSNTTVQIDKGATVNGSGKLEDYPVIPGRWEGATTPTHRALLSAEGSQHIAIVGEGTVSGNAATSFPRPPRMVNGQVTNPPRGDGTRGATVLEFSHCQDVRLEGVTLKQAGVWTTHPVYSQDVLFRNVTFDTRGANSDGIDVDSTARVWIDHCSFTDGDDSIALKSGKGDEGRKSPATENVLITDCVFHRSPYAAVAFGSEISGGVRRVEVDRCTIESGMAYALRMKTSPGRGGFVEDVRARELVSSAQRFMQVIMNVNHPDPQPLEGLPGITTMKNFDVENVKLSGGFFLDIEGSAEKPVAGLRVHNVSGTCTRGMTISHAHGVDLAGIEISGFAGPRLATFDAEGSGLEGAEAMTRAPGATVPDRGR